MVLKFVDGARRLAIRARARRPVAPARLATALWTLTLVALASLACESAPEIARTSTGSVVLDEACLEEGRCECLSNTDCPEAAPFCADGECVESLDGGGLDIDDTGGTGPVGGGGPVGGEEPTSPCSDGRTPQPEQCNAFDDDCDGDIDEDFLGADGELSTPGNCGRCGVSCDELFANLLLDGDGEPVADATTCNAEDDEFVCRPARCKSGYAPLYDEDGLPTVCLPLEISNCQPCSLARECSGGVGHVCHDFNGDGTFCAQRCDADFDPACGGEAGEQGCCPDGFTCTDEAEGLICIPDGGSCQCTEDTEGLVRACALVSAVDGQNCVGSQECTELSTLLYGYTACDTSTLVDYCDGRDNDCNGVIDDSFTDEGAYSLDTNCGACGNDCGALFDPAVQHATATCDEDAGPDCVIDDCLDEAVGGGTLCAVDADCAGNPAGTTCHAVYKQCAKACSGGGECPSGVCNDGWCTSACVDDGVCEAAYGAGATCEAGFCFRTHQFVDLDGFRPNGCECPALADDEPLVLGAYPTAPGSPSVDRNCDGIEGNEARALFVREGASGSGTRANPFGSIQDAIDAFDPADHDHILVATGTYIERITLQSGVRLYGGYSDDFSVRDIALNRTVITATEPNWADAGALPGVVNADGITADTRLVGFTIQGYDVSASPSARGQASYAVYLRDSSSALLLADNEIVGGRGGDGNQGAAGTPGDPGGPGGDGHAARECIAPNCTTNNESEPGGTAGVAGSCGAGTGCPGMEGDGAATQTFSGTPPAGCTYGNGGGDSAYNSGQAKYCKYDCNPDASADASSGADGTAGAHAVSGGTGCSGNAGSITSDRWAGATAGAGAVGAAGVGGQGGLAGGAVVNQKAATCTEPSLGHNFGDIGGTGGGGGAGGCGGSGGTGGQAGGASIAVFIASGASATFPTLEGNRISRGFGGNGGNGGPGGAGGQGGRGGAGGRVTSEAWCGGDGGAGGDGGPGGDGGGGGGGCGGPSYGIAGVSGIPSATYTSANTFPISADRSGTAGDGGVAPKAADGANGTSGVNQHVRAF